MINLKKLDLAFIHKSYCNEHPGLPSNERLEFLGDSILSLLVSERLYVLFPTSPEGYLTARRSHLVQTTTLAQKSKDLGYDKLLKLSRGEEDSGGRQNIGLLANTFEAVLGALFLDSGIEASREYLREVFPDNELLAEVELKDAKSLLQEKSQSKNMGTPSYRTLQADGPDHAKIFKIEVVIDGKQIGMGSGSSKQKAETAAAQDALVKLFPA
ncbi:MAG: ribonuclease III [Patescibacteria group bacterium]